jgi:hypothetical protein
MLHQIIEASTVAQTMQASATSEPLLHAFDACRERWPSFSVSFGCEAIAVTDRWWAGCAWS